MTHRANQPPMTRCSPFIQVPGMRARRKRTPAHHQHLRILVLGPIDQDLRAKTSGIGFLQRGQYTAYYPAHYYVPLFVFTFV